MITPLEKNCKGFTEMLQFGDKAKNVLLGCDKEGAGGVLWVKAFSPWFQRPLSAGADGIVEEWKRSEPP
jgi:hypothetical protein